jgi:hypothetical protein
MMDATGQAEHARNVGEIAGQFGQQGFDFATQAAQSQYERDRQAQFAAVGQGNQDMFQGIGQMSGLASQAQGLGGAEDQRRLQQINMLESAGQSIRADDQRGKDAAYMDYQEQINWQPNQLANMVGIMSGVPIQPNQTVTGYKPDPTLANTLAGVVTTGAGIQSLFGGND